MEDQFILKQKERLEKEKVKIEKELKDFANRDPNSKYNWQSRYPNYNPDGVGDERRETESDEVEEYDTRIPLEHTLENKLKDIIIALNKIKENKYGICEKCGRKISKKRLLAYPEARLCAKCEQEEQYKSH